MSGLSEKIEHELTPEKFRAWLDDTGNREAAFNARDGEFCPLGQYVNHVVEWEPILNIGIKLVWISDEDDRKEYQPDNERGFLCRLPQWAVAFREHVDSDRRHMDTVPLAQCYQILGEVVSSGRAEGLGEGEK